MSTTAIVILVAVVVVIAAAIAWYLFRQQRSKQLRSRFGPEYNRAIHQYGDQAKAENALLERQKRREKLQIRPLAPEERENMAERWRQVQSHFVDDPAGSITSADQLVNEVMTARGYPMLDFETRANDLSVDHPSVVRNYRAAHAVAVSQHEEGKVSTEGLRQAFMYYRELFDELLDAHVAGPRR